MKRALSCFVSLLMLVMVSASYAQITAVPATMNFQGRLAKPDGTAIPDGTHTLTFRIYDDQIATDISHLRWSEQIGSVNFRNGAFSLVLGKVKPFTDTILNGTPWLEIQIDTDVPLIPRQTFQSVAFALKANTVPDNTITTAKVVDNAIFGTKLAPDAASLAKVSGNTITSNGSSISFFNTMYVNTIFEQHATSEFNIDAPFVIGGRVKVLTNGNVGIGTTSPGQKLTVKGTLSVATTGTTATSTFSAGDSNAIYATNASPNNATIFAQNTQGPVAFLNATGDNKALLANNNGYNSTIVAQNSGPGFAGKFVATGSCGIYAENTSNVSAALYARNYGTYHAIYADGSMYAAGTVYGNGIALNSDARYKTNIATLNNALDDVMNLRGVSYNWDKTKWPNKNFADDKQIGFIAQELEKIFPELVSTDAQGYKSVNYIGVIPVLVEAVKTLKQDNGAMKKEIEELKARVKRQDNLEARLKAIEALIRKPAEAGH